MSNFIDRIIENQPYVIAEIGINHNGDIKLAKEMIDAAAQNGASCVKLQNFIADKYISLKAGRAGYQNQTDVADKSQHQIIKECEISEEESAELFAYAEKIGIDCLSTPFEIWSLRMLINLNVPAMKISSCNLTNYPLLGELAESGIPALISTGMAGLDEVESAVNIFKKSNSPLLIFQCTSNYPSMIENANLRVIQDYQNRFNVPVGFSDHTPSNIAAIAAVAMGAVTVEKHFTLSKDLPGIDQKASIEPDELKKLVEDLKNAYSALGEPLKKRTPEEEDTFVALRRSLVASRDIAEGEVLTEDMIAIKRPGNGLSTDNIPKIINKRLNRSIEKDDLFTLEDFSE